MRTKSIFTLLAAVVLALSGHAAWSQATLTRAEGTVTNAGKPVPDVQVVFTYQDSGKQSKVKTDKNGAFFLIGLTRGAYTIEVFNAAGENVYREKNHSLTGEGGAVDKLPLELTGPGGSGGQPKVTAEQVEAIRAQNAKATSINALINQYNAALTAKNWQDAITPLQAMVAADPTRWDYIQALGNMQSNAAHYEDAVQTYEKGIQVAQGYVSGATPKDPKNPMTEPAKAKAGMGQMLSAEGNAYLKLQKNPEAIAAYTKAAELDPKPGIAYFNICATQYNVGNMDGAALACEKAIQADPSKADAYFIKGSAMYGNGKLDANNKYSVPPGTTDALKKYLELAPDGAHANDVKAMLDALGQTMETTYKGGKKK